MRTPAKQVFETPPTPRVGGRRKTCQTLKALQSDPGPAICGRIRNALLIPKVVDIDPFHPVALWVDSCRQSGARCAAVPDTASLRDAAGDKERSAVAGGTHRRGRGLRELLSSVCAIWDSGVPHRAARRGPVCASRLMGPADRLAPMKGANIDDLWY